MRELYTPLIVFTGYRKIDTLLKSVPEGTSTILVAALDPGLKGPLSTLNVLEAVSNFSDHNGSFLSDNKIEQTPEYTTDLGLALRLWELSEGLVGQKFVY